MDTQAADSEPALEPELESPPVIEVQGLNKAYGDIRALRDVGFRIAGRRSVALIGPNGAGKSTLIETLMGLRRPDSGSVRVLGVDVCANPRGHVERLGVQLQESRLFPRLTPREYLQFFARLYQHSLPFEVICEELDLHPLLDRRIGQLSGGQRQRVALALAILNDPALVILDEPTVGLDPITRREFWELIQRLRGRGKTILFSTHYMEEAQVLADEILMISQGRLVAFGTAPELIAAARRLGDASTLDDAYALFAKQHQQRESV